MATASATRKKKNSPILWWGLAAGGSLLLLKSVLKGDKPDEMGGLPHGLANKNPLNIIMTNYDFPGEVPDAENTTGGRFEQFYDIEDGWLAALINLQFYLKSGIVTLPEIITNWATGGTKAVPNYVDYVLREAGVAPSTKFKYAATNPGKVWMDQWWAIFRAMAIFENGAKYEGKISAMRPEFEDAWNKLYS